MVMKTMDGLQNLFDSYRIFGETEITGGCLR